MFFVAGAVLFFTKAAALPYKVAWPVLLLSLATFLSRRRELLPFGFAFLFSAAGDAVGARGLFIPQMAFFALAQPGDTILGMNLAHGGHLSHGSPVNISGKYFHIVPYGLGEDETIVETIPADPNVRNFSYTVVDGELYYRQNSIMTKPDFNATAKERAKGMVELRDCVQKLISEQMDGFISDETIRQTQAELNTLYDGFTAKYGLINSRANALAFAEDSSYYLLCSLEELDED